MPSPAPTVTVAICTFNRCDLLRETLASMQAVTYPADRWNLIVIDNNSGDDTRAAVHAFKDAAHPPAWIFEEKQGLDHARNRAIAEARGDILVLADDDILVEPDWIDQLVAPFARGESIACVGGSVFPVFPDGVPSWMRAHWEDILMLTEETAPIPDGKDPMGANLAFRRSVFADVGTFLEGLDRQGNTLFCGGDAEMVRRLRKKGYEAWFAPKAAVRHQFPRERMNLKYALRHGYGSARSKVYNVAHSGTFSPGYKQRYLFTRFFANLCKGVAQGLLAAVLLVLVPPWGKTLLIQAARSAGYVRQILATWCAK